MDLKSMALAMYPYWILGASVLVATILAGKKNLIRVEKKPVLDWVKFLAVVTFWRVIMFKLFPSATASVGKNIAFLPWQLTLTVFWEDACHGLPLLMIKKAFGASKWLKPLYWAIVGLVMLEFGLGHVYQGVFAACLLSLYIPYSIKLGEKYGFGTVMVGHTLFDLTTILTVKFLMGA